MASEKATKAWSASIAVADVQIKPWCAFEAAISCLVAVLRLMQTAFEEDQPNQLSGDDYGFPEESTTTVSVNEKPYPVQMYMRSCENYANWSVVAAHKKLYPVEMYWRSREIYENECMEADTKNTHVVEVSVEDPLDVSMDGDDGSVWDEALEFSVETRSSYCVSVNLWDRDPVYDDPRGAGVFTRLSVLIDFVWGSRGSKLNVYLW